MPSFCCCVVAAMSVRVAHSVSDRPVADDYRVAFLVLASLVGIARLPRDAGNHFIDRGAAPASRKLTGK